MKKILIAIAVSALFAGQVSATEHKPPKEQEKGNTIAAAASSSTAIAGAAAVASGGKASASAKGGAGGAGGKGGAGGQGGQGFGGQGGNASANNSGQQVSFTGSDMGKLAPDISPPSMPSVTPCTTGISGGISIGGVGVGGGGYSYDDLCGWERQHAVAIATSDLATAADIKHGMTMLRCQRMSPDDRKFFKACEALPKEKEGQAPNSVLFQSN